MRLSKSYPQIPLNQYPTFLNLIYNASSLNELLYPTPNESNATKENLNPNSGSGYFCSFSDSKVMSLSLIY